MLEPWQGFFQASAAASATLAGLLVVAISINLARILEFPNLPDRAGAALVPLGGVLALALLGIVPGQPPRLFGIEFLVGGAATWAASLFPLIRSFRRAPNAKLVWMVQHVTLNQLQTLPLVVAGGLLVAGAPSGLYWMVPGVIAALLAGILNAWVLLIEILR